MKTLEVSCLPLRFYIATMGCQMNEYDSDHMAQVLIDAGYRAAESPGEADLVLINTCTVRAKAEQKAFSLLGRMAGLKKKRPGLILGITGCIAQQQGSLLLERFPALDLVLGTREVHGVAGFVEGIRQGGDRVVAGRLDLLPPPPPLRNGYFRRRVKALLSIMEGCNNFCTYCVVPYVRGREWSRPPEQLLAEARRLLSQGVKEITLLGQNVNSYRFDAGQPYDFPSLLRDMNSLEGLRRLRFTTSHPKDLSEDLMGCFSELETLCPHLHLPVQAGSDSVLRRMHRGYTRETYMGLVERMRRARPDIALTSDVMVGFPGETEQDFEDTLDLIREVSFDGMYSFKYSDRPGTPAAEMDGKVDEEVKTDRLIRLQSLQRSITFRRNRDLEGREVEILVDGASRRGGQLTGRTVTNKVVNFTCNSSKYGNTVKVVIKDGCINSLRGEILDI
ncbi:MAG: tRNA (N6-isopentenyl adenosine(37)-C2)-methylthiotransferase MiaB [Deltaproteobacteria bacterium]|nr:tRNA (N6-isopentenyl adenosine(37)-C2)-methylthiotransferase MiaB [Deltaproteobacteria bacterium]